jgi:hypothetical protein
MIRFKNTPFNSGPVRADHVGDSAGYLGTGGQAQAFVNTLTIETGLALMAAWEKHQKKNKGEDTFGKDPPLPTRQLDGGPDNCADLLHPGR